ncbi:MAG: leucine--tRNA ligase [bacterium]
MAYNPQEIEPKWQEIWEKEKIFRAEDFSRKHKKYLLIEFPYPSGEGLHVGHCRSYSAMDAVARKKRMEGFNVLFPIGWDAFGLPAENYAIKTGIHPKETTAKNIANYTRQLKILGLSFDWSREINTTDPKYYKWTQWIFLKLFEKGLAYQAEIPINWCPSCKTGLANEEVISGNCERCGVQTEKKTLKQWMLKITAYADRLLEDLEKVDYLEKIKAQQTAWVGKSYGAEADFKAEDLDEIIRVFTTRIDTLFGVTAVVLAPEHPLVEKLTKKEKQGEVGQYIKAAKNKSDFEREKLEKEKTGVFTGSYCLNPANSERVPIWIGDFVIASYGGGAVMAVPAHDYRDYDFAKKYGLEIREVVKPARNASHSDAGGDAFVDYGTLINSGKFNGLSSKEAADKITEYLEKKNSGKRTVQYKLRDWIFSRQHYWGEPIPIVHCEKCGVVPVPEKDLPVELPFVEKYQPTGTGESPLAQITDWVNVKCPKCGGLAQRETDTMPNWAGSNWYYMRYVDPNNDKVLADTKKLKYWLPVDWYNGGMEHTTLHLLYSRFIYKFLFDIGAVPTPEPYQRRTSHGVVLAEDGRKMSKSFGNVINPDEIIKEYGADTLRIYEMFMGPFGETIAWSTQGVKGVYRFLDKVWKLAMEDFKGKESGPEILRALHKLNKKIDEDLESTKFNTAIAAFMEFVNLALEQKGKISKDTIEKMLVLLSPFAPHLAEELWEKLGRKKSISFEKWPEPDLSLMKDEIITLVVQINGKVRHKIEARADISEEEAKELAISQKKIKDWLLGKEIKKVIFVPGKLINIVTK